ncbi:hypothetical protein D9758_006018 [Tetrapyrgos nigripes]|uniref:Uncharacterized protein n=1 Tax=Tetrapyrgos nigripes TaxID=182062 RepID=A0A8H5D851_9AGAR|nr:hypothetical protein D9758_006018 [Tetrapyrgos nigripes]
MDNSDSEPTTSFPSTLNFGNGLVEIAALTTLIGSSTAGDLILGNRGAAGLVWGSISAFGSSSVIKACASAACPGWLRQMVGLRTLSSDKAMGMDLSLAPRSKMAKRMRGTMDESRLLGVSCLSDDPDVTLMKESPQIKEHHIYRDIYAFDNTTSIMFSELPPTPPDSPPTVYTHYHYDFFHIHHLRFQVSVLFLSLLKSLEIYTLVIEGGILLGLLSGVPFLFSFASGVCLEANDIMRARRPTEVDSHFDLVAASPLPTTKWLGGPKKVVLGAATNPRRGPWWRFFWIMTGILQTITVILSYVLLGQQKSRVVLIWAGFQLFWVITRILIFSLTEHRDPNANRPMKPYKFESLPLSIKLRVMNLVLGVGSYQAHVHPRNLWAYLDDSFSMRQIARLLVPENMCEEFPLAPRHTLTTDSLQKLDSSVPSPTLVTSPISLTSPKFPTSPSSLSSNSEMTISGPIPRIMKVNILAVIGDTALSSAAWMLGNTKYAPMDFYDSCIIVLEVISPSSSSSSTTLTSISSRRPTSRIVAIPSARVFSATSVFNIAARSGEEALEPLFIARGAGNSPETEKTWFYWVPCEGGEWLQIKSGLSGLTHSDSSSAVNSASASRSKTPVGNTPNAGNVYSVLGHQVAEVLDDQQLSRILGAGNLNISLKHAEEVKGVVEVSRRGSEDLVAFLR